MDLLTVTTVADARAGLSRTLREFRQHPLSEAVILGSHRKPEAALVPIAQYERLSLSAAGQEPVLALLQRKRELIMRLARLSRIDAVRVFGSVARGSETASSDIDVLVTPAEGASLFDFAQFASDLELLTDRPVDVVSVHGVNPASAVGERILAEAVHL